MEAEGLTELPLSELRKRGFVMSVDQWMLRILFLETIAGVPGMVRFISPRWEGRDADVRRLTFVCLFQVGGMCRHLQSLRLMKRGTFTSLFMTWLELTFAFGFSKTVDGSRRSSRKLKTRGFVPGPVFPSFSETYSIFVR